jgi:hypothetical protein
MKASALSKKSSKRRELVEHQEEAMPPAFGFQLLGQPTSDLVEDQSHKRFGAADVRRRHDQVQGRGRLAFD